MWSLAPVLLVLAFGLIPDMATAQSCPGQPYDPDKAAQTRPNIHAPCTERAPEVDARLDDPVWENAAVITDFRQVEPVEGAEPSEKTEVRVLYTPDSVFLGIHAFDSEPSKIKSTVMVRDKNQSPDDYVMVVLGSYGNRRDAFGFIVNPVGARRDFLIENNSDVYDEWNAIWYADARITDDGWVAEIEIPVKSLAFVEDVTNWDFNIIRGIRRKNETVRWAAVSQDLDFRNVSRTGKLEGLQGLDQGLGLDVQTEGALSFKDNNVDGTSGLDFAPSANLFYKLTPSLTGSFTVNTDFAEAAVDERRVNLTRFGLFFPETRDFFLQDVGIFQFGDFGGRNNNGKPFFTRRIGLVEGEVVDILAGGKITGRVGDVNIGLLDVQTDSSEELGIGSKNLAVGRMSVNIMEESSVGAIVTHGNPNGPTDNTLIGTDFRYRNSNFLGNRVLTATAWLQKTETEGVSGNQEAFGARIAYPNDKVSARFQFKQLGENFNPALGFANRTGIREYSTFLQRRWRPQNFLRTIDVQMNGQLTTDTDNNLETLDVLPQVQFQTNADDRLHFGVGIRRERLDQPFFLPHGILVPAGEYTFIRPQIEVRTSNARLFSLNAEVECCRFFNGRSLGIESTVEFRPSPYFFMSVSYEHTDLNMPGGNGIVRVGSAEFNINFTPDIQWSNIVQYDNVSDNIGINSRFRWIVTPGTEMFVVINQNFLADGWDFRRQTSEATIKFGHTFRF